MTAPSAPTTSPTALTTASAATRASSTGASATPTPPATAPSAPRHFPTVALAPAPTAPVGSGSSRAAATAAAYPSSAVGRVPPDATRSKMHAAGTIGTGPPAVGKPWPRSARYCMTPSAVASPNADPPENTTASTRVTKRTGSSTSNSRVAGAPPRTSPEPTDPAGNSNTVTPLPSRVTCPARTPAMGKLAATRCAEPGPGLRGRSQ